MFSAALRLPLRTEGVGYYGANSKENSNIEMQLPLVYSISLAVARTTS